MSFDKIHSTKYKEYVFANNIMTNLTNFSLYLKWKSNPNKVALTKVLVKKLNKSLIDWWFDNMPSGKFDDFLS